MLKVRHTVLLLKAIQLVCCLPSCMLGTQNVTKHLQGVTQFLQHVVSEDVKLALWAAAHSRLARVTLRVTDASTGSLQSCESMSGAR